MELQDFGFPYFSNSIRCVNCKKEELTSLSFFFAALQITEETEIHTDSQNNTHIILFFTVSMFLRCCEICDLELLYRVLFLSRRHTFADTFRGFTALC